MDPNSVVEPNGLVLFVQHLFSAESYIPSVMILFAFFASLTWTVLKIIELVNRRSVLEFRLTRECFLRIIESGECFYINAVIISLNACALIESVEVGLKRRNGATKKYNLSIIHLGEKAKSANLLSQYYFYSSSPISYLSDSVPQRVTYVCLQEEYAEAIQKAYRELGSEYLKLREKYSQAEAQESGDIAQAGVEEIKSIIQKTSNQIVESIQIEPGNHELSVTISYRQRGRIIPFYRRKQATSSLKFFVEPNVREVLKIRINQYVEALIRNLVLGRSDIVPYPDYIPSQICEQV